jgi:archaellum biogenesis protein FlaJ (TadC family)
MINKNISSILILALIIIWFIYNLRVKYKIDTALKKELLNGFINRKTKMYYFRKRLFVVFASLFIIFLAILVLIYFTLNGGTD